MRRRQLSDEEEEVKEVNTTMALRAIETVKI